MSLMQEILKHIQSNPGLSSADLKHVFPEHPRTAVQRAAYRLFECGYLTRAEVKSQYCYYPAMSSPDSVGMPLEEVCRAASLIFKAEALEARGLYQRAATVWFEAFRASRITAERERCLKRRQKCLHSSPAPKKHHDICHLAGHYKGEK